MPTLLLPEDAEQAIIDELSPYYAIGTQIPDFKPELFLRVVSAGGFQRDIVTDSFLVTLEAFALRESIARDALVEAVGRLDASQRARGKIGGAVCYRIPLSATIQNFPLPSVPSHKRYITTLAPDFRRQVIQVG